MTPDRVGIRRRHTYSGYFTWSVFRVRRLAHACIQYSSADTSCIHVAPGFGASSGAVRRVAGLRLATVTADGGTRRRLLGVATACRHRSGCGQPPDARY
eukprot:6434700-Prymnesium_polylepis.1